MAANNTSDLLSYVKKSVKRNKDARRPVEARWYENAAFAAGFTSVEYDPRRQRPVAVGGQTDESTNPQVQDKLRKYQAKLIAPRAMPQCVAAKNDRDARRRAEVANALILHFWEKKEFIYADHASKLNMMVFGNGLLATQWNPTSGEWVTEYEYEGGSPVYDTFPDPGLDAEGLPLLIDQPMKQVREARSQSWQSGLPHMRSVHPFNFFPDPQWRHLTTDQCLNYAERKLVPFDLVEHHFPDIDIDKVGYIEAGEDYFLFREVDASFGLRGEDSAFHANRMVEVWDFYHSPIVLPSKGIKYPRGFRMMAIGDQIIDLIDHLPYNQYPHSTFRDRQYSDRGWGMCITDVLRMAQKRLDLVEKIQIRAAERSADPPLLKPQGSSDVAFQGRPGEVYEYMPYGEEKPSYMMPPAIPPHLFQMRTDALADLESLSLTAAPVGGSTPARGDSAAYLDRLLEENQAAMAPTVQEIEVAKSHQAATLLRLSQDHLPIGFKFTVMGRDKIPHVEEFDGKSFDLLEVRIVPGSAAMTYPGQLRTSVMQLAANGLLQDTSPRSSIITELMLGAPMAARLTDLDEPGDKAVTEINIRRILEGREPFFKEWMDHEKCIRVLLENMRDPRYFLEFSVDHQDKLEQLLQRHQAAIAPQPSPEAMMGMEGTEGQTAMPGGEGGRGGTQAAPRGAAQVPAKSQGYTGPMGGGAQGNPLLSLIAGKGKK